MKFRDRLRQVEHGEVIPSDWIDVSRLDQSHKGGRITILKMLPLMRVALIQGMTEAGSSRDEAVAHVEKNFYATKDFRSSPETGRYLSPKAVELLEEVGIVKKRWTDLISEGESPEKTDANHR